MSMDAEQLEALGAAIREAGAVKVAEAAKETDAELPALTEELARRGFERSEKHFRVPLGEQLRARVAAEAAAEAALPLKGLRKRLGGVESADELSFAVEQACEAGPLARVTTSAGAALAQAEAALDEAEMAALGALAEGLRKLLARAKRGGAPLHRPEVDALFAGVGLDAGHYAPLDEAALREALLAEGDASRQLLVPVPALVRALAPAPLAATHAALEAAAAEGALELRPASSVAAVPDEDARLCPRTADGVPIHYVRRLKP